MDLSPGMGGIRIKRFDCVIDETPWCRKNRKNDFAIGSESPTTWQEETCSEETWGRFACAGAQRQLKTRRSSEIPTLMTRSAASIFEMVI